MLMKHWPNGKVDTVSEVLTHSCEKVMLRICYVTSVFVKTYCTKLYIFDFFFSLWQVIVVNILIVATCVLVAMFYPHIGDIIR